MKILEDSYHYVNAKMVGEEPIVSRIGVITKGVNLGDCFIEVIKSETLV